MAEFVTVRCRAGFEVLSQLSKRLAFIEFVPLKKFSGQKINIMRVRHNKVAIGGWTNSFNTPFTFFNICNKFLFIALSAMEVTTNLIF